MKIRHYKNCWDTFETESIGPEIDALKQNGQWKELAERIVSEWSVLPDAQKKRHIDSLKEALAHLDPVSDSALIFQISQCHAAFSDIDKSLADGNECRSMLNFSGFAKADGETGQSSDTPFALTEKMLHSKGFTEADRERLYSAIPDSGTKKLLSYRWKQEGSGGSFPRKYAAGQRTLFAPSIKKNAEKDLLQWTLDPSGALPEAFGEMHFFNGDHPEDSLKIFEDMGNFQALLTFLGHNPDKFPKFCFLNCFLYAWTCTPDLLDCKALEKECASEFQRAVVGSIALADENAKRTLEAMAEAEPEAGTALYVLRLRNGSKPEKDLLLKAVRHGSSAAAFLLVRDFAEKNPEIAALAKRSILSEEYCGYGGRKLPRPFTAVAGGEPISVIREKVMNRLSEDDLSAMTALWSRFVAENPDPEKMAELYQVLYLLAVKRNDRPVDAMIRSAVAGNLDALLDWYDFVKKNGWIVYQKRIRDVIRGFHKLTPYQKVRLDLLKLVKG